MSNKFIDINMLDIKLAQLIETMSKSYPVDYLFVTANLNPNNYEYVKVVDDTVHKAEIYKWETDEWVYVGKDTVIIKWDDIQNKPVIFAPATHTHLKADITDFAHSHPEYAPTVHNHDGVYSPINHDHNLTYAPLNHSHDGTYSLINHLHDGRYYTQLQTDAKLGNLADLTTENKSSLVSAINELKELIGLGSGGGGNDMPLLVVEDEWEGSSSITKTFTNNCMGFSIVNTGTSTLVATINGKTIQVDAQESFENIFKPFKTLSITASGTYKALVTAPYGVVTVIDTTPPNNVTNLAASNVMGTSLTLSWIASTSNDVDTYNVFQGPTLIGTTSGTTFNVTGLSTSTSYIFTVKAKDLSGNINTGTSVNATTNTTVDTTPPNNVTSLGAVNVSTNSVTLTWSESTSSDAATYDIYDGSTLLASVNHPTVNYSVTGLNPSTSYTLTVKAKDTSGNVASGTSVNFTTTTAIDTTPPVITANPLGGTYTSATVTLTANETSTIYYTTDGSTPTTSSSVYNAPISITTTTTLKYFGKDLANNQSVVQTQTYTINASVGGGTVLFNDTFNRADSTSIGTSDSGHAWTGYTNVNGTVTLGIRNNMAYMSGGTWNATNKFRRFTTVPIASNHFKIDVVPKMLTTGDNMGICIRMPVLDGNMIYLNIPTNATAPNKYILAKLPSGGSVTNLGQSTVNASVGDIISIEHHSSGQIKVYINGSLQIDATDTLSLAGNTLVGIGVNANIVDLGIDSFKVTQM